MHVFCSGICIINPRRACAAVVDSVCLSVKLHLTSGAFVHPENAVTYSAGSKSQKICRVFSETTSLQRSSISLRHTASAQFEGTYCLIGIRFSWFEKANDRPKATWNTNQCETATYLSLSAAPVSVPCLAIFCIRSRYM